MRPKPNCDRLAATEAAPRALHLLRDLVTVPCRRVAKPQQLHVPELSSSADETTGGPQSPHAETTQPNLHTVTDTERRAHEEPRHTARNRG
jgi:hypothetical protein